MDVASTCLYRLAKEVRSFCRCFLFEHVNLQRKCISWTKRSSWNFFFQKKKRNIFLPYTAVDINAKQQEKLVILLKFWYIWDEFLARILLQSWNHQICLSKRLSFSLFFSLLKISQRCFLVDYYHQMSYNKLGTWISKRSKSNHR